MTVSFRPMNAPEYIPNVKSVSITPERVLVNTADKTITLINVRTFDILEENFTDSYEKEETKT